MDSRSEVLEAAKCRMSVWCWMETCRDLREIKKLTITDAPTAPFSSEAVPSLRRRSGTLSWELFLGGYRFSGTLREREEDREGNSGPRLGSVAVISVLVF